MLQNKIYQNYFIEIIKPFFIIFGLSLIALTVRAVNFLELNSRQWLSNNYLFSIFIFKYVWNSAKIYTSIFFIIIIIFILSI